MTKQSFFALGVAIFMAACSDEGATETQIIQEVSAEDFSCSSQELKDKSGIKIICNGDSIGVVLNGEKGAKGDDGEKGDDGKLSLEFKVRRHARVTSRYTVSAVWEHVSNKSFDAPQI